VPIGMIVAVKDLPPRQLPPILMAMEAAEAMHLLAFMDFELRTSTPLPDRGPLLM